MPKHAGPIPGISFSSVPQLGQYSIIIHLWVAALSLRARLCAIPADKQISHRHPNLLYLENPCLENSEIVFSLWHCLQRT